MANDVQWHDSDSEKSEYIEKNQVIGSEFEDYTMRKYAITVQRFISNSYVIILDKRTTMKLEKANK